MKNFSAFIDLCLLIVSCQVCIATPGEVLNLINKDEFSFALILLGVGLFSLYIGVSSIGSLKKYINK